MSHLNLCPECQQNPCCCPSNQRNINRIENNPININTFNPVINVTGCCDGNQPPPVDTACTCTGFLSDTLFGTANAEICPNCDLTQSFFTFDADFSFESNFVSPPICEPTFAEGVEIGISLNTGGTGVVTTPDGTFSAGFSLMLHERTGASLDSYAFTFTFIDENGFVNSSSFSASNIPDSSVVVAECPLTTTTIPRPTPSSTQVTTSPTGKIVKIVNGVITEELEL